MRINWHQLKMLGLKESLEFTSNSGIDGNYMSAYKCYPSDFSVALCTGDQSLCLAQILPHYPNLVSNKPIKIK